MYNFLITFGIWQIVICMIKIVFVMRVMQPHSQSQNTMWGVEEFSPKSKAQIPTGPCGVEWARPIGIR